MFGAGRYGSLGSYRAACWCPGREGLLFVNKKKQKNFMTVLRAKNFVTARSTLGVGDSALSARPAVPGDRSFLRAFFQKRAACLLIPAY
jgi:hypothetical protein